MSLRRLANGPNPVRMAGSVVVVGLATWICCAPSLNSATAGSPIPCDLKMKLGKRSEGPPQQFHVNLAFVNDDDITHTACRLSGYPDVELIGPVYPIFGTIYSLPRSFGRAESVSLRFGQAAHADLTWLPSSPGLRDRWTPGYVRVVVHTNRGPSFAMALPWPYGSVLRQDGATHPGTYVGPIRQGANWGARPTVCGFSPLRPTVLVHES
jgi:hypothetical protein